MLDVLKKIKNYTIYNCESLATENATGTKKGYIEIVSEGVYCIKGNLPEYVNKQLAKIAEKRGFKYWFNGKSYFNVEGVK